MGAAPPPDGPLVITVITLSALVPALMVRIPSSLTQRYLCVREVAGWIRTRVAVLTGRPCAVPNSPSSTPRDTTRRTTSAPTTAVMAGTGITTVDTATTTEGMDTTITS